MRVRCVHLAVGIGSVLLACSGEDPTDDAGRDEAGGGVAFDGSASSPAADLAVGDAGGGPAGDAGQDAGTSEACASPRGLEMPPGAIPWRGEWNACPYNGSGREHAALDYTSRKWTPLEAGLDGTIQYVRYERDPRCHVDGASCTAACLASGDYLVLKAACGDPARPGNELFVRYFHIAGVRRGLKVGDTVARGEVIAYVGDSGCASGAHVHLQLATFKAGTYALGKPPLFGDCASTLNPATAFAGR